MSGCQHFDAGRCHSCSLMSVPLDTQLESKNLLLQKTIGLTPEDPCRSSAWNFRDKVKLTVTGTIESPSIGLLQNDLKTTVELNDCPVQAEELNRHIPQLKNFISKWRLTPYDIPARKGELKGIIMSWSPETKQKMIRFVLRSKEALDRIRQGISELKDFAVISVNIQPVAHALLEGSEEIVLSEQNALMHSTRDVQLAFSPQSFMQTNSQVARELYATAVDWLAPWRKAKALDLFCGVGGFGLSLAKHGQQVLGVEINSAAVMLANTMSESQQLGARFLAAPAESIESIWREWNPTVVVVNPPRRGLASTRLLIEKMNPEVLLYSSCSPESLKLDIDALKNQFEAQRTKLFDMFPHTNHFESLTLLVRR